MFLMIKRTYAQYQVRNWKASIVMPALNEVNYIEKSLKSIIEAVDTLDDPNQVNVFVIDNGSTDGTQEAIQDLTAKRRNFHWLTELRPGVGYARQSGAEAALQYAPAQEGSQRNGLWIICTDADVLVPKDWLVNWFSLFESDNPGIVIGNGRFPADLAMTNPRASQIMEAVGKKIALAEKLFGVINTDGNHLAIASDCYNVIGPFQQPYRITPEGKKENLAGEDWDMGTRARTLNMTIARSPHDPITLSPRRFHTNPIDFFDGTAYEVEFQRVDSDTPAADIDASLFERLLTIATYRQCMHFIEKPLLADSSLLDCREVQQFLGQHLHREIERWIEHNPKPDIFQERNRFILDYLAAFHHEFGGDINKQLLAYA